MKLNLKKEGKKMNKKEFKKLENKYMDKLKKFVPIVNKVHGKDHPEFNKVKTEFDLMVEKITNENYKIIEQFDHLKMITNNYQVPEDTCESYEMVYQMLKELDD